MQIFQIKFIVVGITYTKDTHNRVNWFGILQRFDNGKIFLLTDRTRSRIVVDGGVGNNIATGIMAE